MHWFHGRRNVVDGGTFVLLACYYYVLGSTVGTPSFEASTECRLRALYSKKGLSIMELRCNVKFEIFEKLEPFLECLKNSFRLSDILLLINIDLPQFIKPFL